MSNSEPSAIVLQGIPCICGLYTRFDSNGENGLRALLGRLKRQGIVPFRFIADDHDISRLPAWVKTGRQTTNGHLAELARAYDSVPATLDGRIPSAFVIPS